MVLAEKSEKRLVAFAEQDNQPIQTNDTENETVRLAATFVLVQLPKILFVLLQKIPTVIESNVVMRSQQIALDIEIKEEIIDDDIPKSEATPFVHDENTTEFMGFDPESIIKIEDDSLDALELQPNFLFVNCQWNESKIGNPTNSGVENKSKVAAEPSTDSGVASTSMIIELATHRVFETISRQQIALDIEIKEEDIKENVEPVDEPILVEPASVELTHFEMFMAAQLLDVPAPPAADQQPLVEEHIDECETDATIAETVVCTTNDIDMCDAVAIDLPSECVVREEEVLSETIIVNEPSVSGSKPKPKPRPVTNKQSAPTTSDTHILSSIDDNPIDSICMTCDKEFIYRRTSDLLVHMQTVHDCNILLKEIHVCPICKVAKASSFSLRRHINAVHHHIRNLQCELCDKKFYYAESLKNHQRLHTLVCPFVCEICGKKFLTNSGLYVSIFIFI